MPPRARIARWSLVALALAGVVACGRESTVDGAVDAHADAAEGDASTADAGPDTPADVGVDAETDPDTEADVPDAADVDVPDVPDVPDVTDAGVDADRDAEVADTDVSDAEASDSGDVADVDPPDADAGDATDATDAADAADAAPDAAVDASPDVDDGGTDVSPDAPPLPAMPDLAIGPWPSALALFENSATRLAGSWDTSETYTHVAAQGYLLQAIGHVLWAARGYDLPSRDALVDLALGEIDELQAADDRVLSGGPAFGLPEAWDAFGDGSTNPAFTAYTWQSGMAALGVARIARYLVDAGHPQAAEVRAYGVALVDYWTPYWTANADGGWFWYSDRASDAIAVHNTSALVAMASQLLAESGGPARLGTRPEQCVDLLWARMSGNPTIGYRWNYADDGIAVGSRRAEDVSHALVTLQLMRFAGDRGWFSASQMRGVAATLRDTMWTGNPARLTGRVDGSSGGDREWVWSRAAAIGYAAHGDAAGGDALVFDLARSLLVSTDLARNDRAFDGSVSATGILTLALLLAHTPSAFDGGSRWTQVAGPGDDALPADATGGARFYTVEWAAPRTVTAGATALVGRAATATTANLLVDLPPAVTGRVAVSITWSSTSAGNVQQWDGARYETLAPLPATRDDEGTVRWWRTTFELAAGHRHDYQAGVPGVNVLLQLTGATPTVHAIEVTPL